MEKIHIKYFRKFVNIEKYLFRAKNQIDLLRKITKEAVSLLDVDVASIFSINYEDMMLIGETGYGIDEKEIKKIRVPLSSSKTALEAFKSKKPVTVFDVQKEGKIPEGFVKKYGFCSSLILPLLSSKKKRIFGFLFLDVVRRTKRFTIEEKLVAERFANLTAIAIEQTKLRESLEKKLNILSAYKEITAAALRPLKIRDIMRRVIVSSTNVLRMDGALIQIAENGKLKIESHIGFPKSYLKKYSKIRIGYHISGRVAKTLNPIILEDASKDPRATKEVVKMIGYRSLISIPLLAEDRLIGVLTVVSSKVRKFKKEEIDYFTNVGRELGVIFENAILFERMELSNKKIKALVELNQSIVSILDLPLLYKKVLDELPSIIPCYSASIMLIDQEKGKLNVVFTSAYGPKRREREKISVKIGKGITGKVAKTGRPQIIPDIRKRKEYIGNLREIRSEIAVPLSVKDKIIGVLNVESKKLNAYTKEDLELLTAFANELAIAIENARLYQESKERTVHLELINRVIKEFRETQDINTISQKLCKTIQRHFYYDHTLLFLLDKTEENLVLKGCAGFPYKIAEFNQSIEKGLLGLCVRTRKSVLENNTKNNKIFVWQLAKEEKPLSEMDIPLIFGNKVLGALSLQSKTQNTFSEWDLMTMENISEHIASSLNNAKLFSHLRQSLSGLSSVYEIGVDLSLSRNLDELLEKIYRRTSLMTGARTFYVALYNEKDNTVRFKIDYEEGEKKPQETFNLRDTGGYTGWILKNNSPILIKNLDKETTEYPVKPIVEGLKMQSYLGVPIRFKSKAIGVLSLQSPKPNLFDDYALTLFTTFANQLGVVIENARLFTQMNIVLKKLEMSYGETLKSLVSALDFRERETRYHSLRVAMFAVELAKRIGIPEDELKFIYWGGMLHDIGKIGVPDEILLKPSKLSKKEWVEIKKHPKIGYEIVKGINFLKGASDIVLYHHEWWNGSGYPYGKRNDEIPLYARIFSVVDALDSMTSERSYKKAVSFEEAYKEIQKFSGTQFDPGVVEAFSAVQLKLWERIKKVKPFAVKFELPRLEKIYTID